MQRTIAKLLTVNAVVEAYGDTEARIAAFGDREDAVETLGKGDVVSVIVGNKILEQ